MTCAFEMSVTPPEFSQSDDSNGLNGNTHLVQKLFSCSSTPPRFHLTVRFPLTCPSLFKSPTGGNREGNILSWWDITEKGRLWGKIDAESERNRKRDGNGGEREGGKKRRSEVAMSQEFNSVTYIQTREREGESERGRERQGGRI